MLMLLQRNDDAPELNRDDSRQRLCVHQHAHAVYFLCAGLLRAQQQLGI